MYSLTPNRRSNSWLRWRYRYQRILMSRSYWLLSRIVLPILVILWVGWRILVSGVLENQLGAIGNSLFENVAAWDMFKVETMNVEGVSEERAELVRAALEIELPTSALKLDRDDIRARLADLSFIEDVSLRIGLGEGIDVNITPRTPALVYFDGTHFETVDSKGYVVAIVEGPDPSGALPLVTGAGAQFAAEEAVKLMKVLAPYQDKIKGLVRVGERRWNIELLSGAMIMLPAERPFDALRLLLSSEKNAEALSRDIKVFDYRDIKRPVIRLNPRAIEELERVKQAKKGSAT